MANGWGAAHPGPGSYDSALKDCELVVRRLNAGADGFNRWSFINRGDLDGVWQMIDTWDPQRKTLRETITPRPNAYFGYGLISRLTAKHSRVVACERTGGQLDGTNRVFATGLKSPKGQLTWIVVNDAPREWDVEFSLNGTRGRPLYMYRVTAAQKDRPDLRIDPHRAVTITRPSITFSDRLPPMSPSVPAVIEPPETLEILFRVGSHPASFNRQSEPRWYSIAR